MKPIVKTEEQALELAKQECLKQLKAEHNVELNEEQIINDDKHWLELPTYCECDCGQTFAVHLTLYCNDIPGIEIKEQFYSIVGVCETCGE